MKKQLFGLYEQIEDYISLNTTLDKIHNDIIIIITRNEKEHCYQITEIQPTEPLPNRRDKL